MRTSTLRKQFKAANKRVDKAIARYKNLIDSLWVENSRGELIHATPLCFTWRRGYGWDITGCISHSYGVFYRRGRGEKRLAETWGEFKPFNVKQVNPLIVKKLEDKLDAAFSERNRLLSELKAAGVDVWKDAELWQ